MKSKPPPKKAKLLLEAAAAQQLGSISPSSSSTSSTVSSLLSIPPATSAGASFLPSSSRPSADLLAAAKAVTSGVKAQQSAAATAVGTSSTTAAANALLVKALLTGPNSGIMYPTYPVIELSEWPKMGVLIGCPKGSSSANLGPEGIMLMDDLDSLQSELETLWSSMACRIRCLRKDQSSLQSSSATSSAVNVAATLGEHFDPHHQEKINAVASLIDAGHGTRTSVSAAAKLVMGSQSTAATSGTRAASPAPSAASSVSTTTTPTTTPTATPKKAGVGGGKKGGDNLPKKKLKAEQGAGTKKGGDKPASRGAKNRTHSFSSDLGGVDGFYKHEAPNEFWEFADKYCGEIQQEHLDDLSEIIEEHRELPESLFEIPPLGKHFKDGESSKPKKDSKSAATKRADACGPLTQRLVSALVDERVAMHQNQKNQGLNSPRDDSANGNSNEHSFIHRAGLIKALSLDSGPGRPPMETQLRDCLLERGFLRPEDANDPYLSSPDDEILSEIKRTQNTLRKLHDYNSDKLKDLFAKGQREIERTPLKADLDQADKEVIDAYKAIAALRQKRKPVTKKEKDVAAKALENREKALQKLSPTKPSTGPTGVLKIEV